MTALVMIGGLLPLVACLVAEVSKSRVLLLRKALPVQRDLLTGLLWAHVFSFVMVRNDTCNRPAAPSCTFMHLM